MDTNISGTLLIKSTQLFEYADHIPIMSRKLTDAEELLHKSMNDTAANEVGLRVNADKTKIMIQSRSRTPAHSSINIGDLYIELVDSFIYLISGLLKDANTASE